MSNVKARILIVCVILVGTLFSLSPHPVLAQDKVQVDHIAVGFEKLKEKINLFFNFSKTGKTKYQIALTEKRLAELRYVVDSEQVDLTEETASRYATYVGNLTNYVVKNNVASYKSEINSMFETHKTALETMRNKFTFRSAWWLMLQQDIDTVNIFQNKLDSLKASGT